MSARDKTRIGDALRSSTPKKRTTPKRTTPKRTQGAVALRLGLMSIGYHLQAAEAFLKVATSDARDLGVVDELAIATKALRTIVNSGSADNRSRGVARAALEKMRVKP